MLHGMTTTTIYDEYGIFNRLMIDHTAYATPAETGKYSFTLRQYQDELNFSQKNPTAKCQKEVLKKNYNAEC